MVSNKGDYRITSLKGKLSGLLNIEMSPCDEKGRILTDKDGVIIRNPEKDLLNQQIHFIIKINALNDIDKNFEDIFVQFGIFSNTNLNKTEVVKLNNKIDFKFSKQFDMVVTPEVYFICIYFFLID